MVHLVAATNLKTVKTNLIPACHWLRRVCTHAVVLVSLVINAHSEIRSITQNLRQANQHLFISMQYLPSTCSGVQVYFLGDLMQDAVPVAQHGVCQCDAASRLQHLAIGIHAENTTNIHALISDRRLTNTEHSWNTSSHNAIHFKCTYIFIHK